MILSIPKHILEIHSFRPKKNLYLKLRGGIGNQLFIYMAGLSLAHQNNLQLIVDARGIDHLESIQELALPGKFRKSRVYWKIQRMLNSRTIDYENLSIQEREKLDCGINGNCTLYGFFRHLNIWNC